MGKSDKVNPSGLLGRQEHQIERSEFDLGIWLSESVIH